MSHRVPPLVIAVFVVLMLTSYLLIARLLGLPSNWFSFDVWQTIPLGKRVALNFGAFFVSLVGTLGAYAIMVDMNIGFGRPRTSVEMVERAVYLGQRALNSYLSLCKDMSAYKKGLLIEDLPSTVSPEEERLFFQNNQDLKLAEAYFKQAIAMEEQTPSKHHTYNIATGYNQLGAHYRFVRDWENATQYLNISLPLFDELRGSNPDNPNILGEMATTYYHLGQVYMMRYRESNDQDDRDLARRNFEKSIAIDRDLGRDYTEMTRLLQRL